VAIINPDGVVYDAGSTWGEVKDLFD